MIRLNGQPAPYLWIFPMMIAVFFGISPFVSTIQGAEVPSLSTDRKPNSFPAAVVAGMKDIHDIKPAIEPGLDVWRLFFILSGAILAILLLWLLWCLWRGRGKESAVSVERLPPDLEAFQHLAELEPVDPLQGKRFYFRLSGILRHYIQRQYGLDAPEMTTEELLPRITGMALTRATAQGLKALIISTDPIKFAGIPADGNKMNADLDFVKSFVKETTAQTRLDATEHMETHV